MAEIKDNLGNVLKLGDLVHVRFGTEWIRGRVAGIESPGVIVSGRPGEKFKPGSVLTGGKDDIGKMIQVPGKILIMADVVVQVDPEHPIATGVLRLDETKESRERFDADVKKAQLEMASKKAN